MKRETKRRIQNAALYFLLVLVAINTLFPLMWALSASFRSDLELFSYVIPFNVHTMIPVEFTVDSWIALFEEYNMQRPLFNSFFVTVVTIFVGCIINSMAAFALAMFDFPFKKVIFAMVLLSFMIPFDVIALPLYQVVDSMDMVDTYWGLILPGLANGLVMFLFIQFFKEIPRDLLDAARVDGASIGMVFIKILVPLSKPVFITAGLMLFMNQWNSYLWPLLVARSGNMRTMQIALAAFRTEEGTAWSALYAGSMLAAFVPLAFFLPLQKYFVQGITSGGVKG